VIKEGSAMEREDEKQKKLKNIHSKEGVYKTA
jgi:hypothetical protein